MMPRSCAAALAATCAVLAGPAAAATFSFSGTVTLSPGPAMSVAEPDFPPLGTPGIVDLFIDDGDPSLATAGAFGVAGFATAVVDVPGYLSGQMSYDPVEGGFVTAGSFGFGAYGPTFVDRPGAATFFAGNLQSVTVEFDALPGPPATVADLVTAISQPGTIGTYGFEVQDTDTLEFFSVDVSFGPTPIPVPAAGWLRGAGLAGLGLIGCRHAAQGAIGGVERA